MHPIQTASDTASVILGSSSPRRLELLSLLIPRKRIHVVPPIDGSEEGFAGLDSLAAIRQQLSKITRTKNEIVRAQISSENHPSLILTADTIIIAAEADGTPMVLGKPDGPQWESTVRNWFSKYYFGRTHQVATGICLMTADGVQIEQQVFTEVRLAQANKDLLEWYLATGEPLGKAGGYGIQGAGGMFIESVTGSISNVIGLPLECLWELLKDQKFI